MLYIFFWRTSRLNQTFLTAKCASGLRNERRRNGFVTVRAELDRRETGLTSLQIPVFVRRSPDGKVGFAVAVIAARDRNIAVCPERNREKAQILTSQNK